MPGGGSARHRGSRAGQPIGFVLLLAGAIGYHARAGEYGRRSDAFAPPVLLILSGVLGVLLLNGV